MRNLKSESKEHYKSYKAGKHWVFACITVMSLGLGLVGANETAQADTNNASEPDTSVVAPSANEQTPAAGDTVNDTKSNGDSGVDKVQGSANDAGAIDSDTGKDVNQDINNDENKDGNGEEANKNVDSDKDVQNNVIGDKQNDSDEDVQNNVIGDKQNDSNDDVQNQNQPENQQQPGSQQPENSAAPENEVGQTSVDENLNGDKQEDVSNLGPVKPVAESYSLLRDEAPSINGVDASVWMPDANLRAWVEGYLSSTWRIEVNDANLSEYVKKATGLYDGYGATIAHPNNQTYAGPISSLEGLQYFTNLTTIGYYGYIPASGMINFSFAPGLTSLTLNNKGTATGTMDATTLINLLANNKKLKWLNVSNYGLTGQVPDFSGFADLESIQMGHNQLTGAIPSLATMPKVTYLYLAYNHLTDIPDMSGYTDTYDFSDNNLVTGIQKNAGITGNTMRQTITGKDYTITPTVRSFDPITDVIKGVQDENGQIDLTDPMIPYNLGTPGDLDFTIETDPDNPIGFNIVAAEGTPNGTYIINVFNQKTQQYDFELTFTITNGTDPVVDPGTGTTDPGTGTTDPGTGTTNPDTNTNPGTGTSTITPGTDTTTTPDVTVDNGGDADQVVTNNDLDATTTPQTGGDAATIDATTPAKAKQVAKAGQADQLVAKTSRQSAKSVTEFKGQAAKAVAPKALATSGHHDSAMTANQGKTTLPQTNERSGASLLAAGVALLVATLGMGFNAKRHE